MDTRIELLEHEEQEIFKAIDDFREHGRTNIICPRGGGKLKYVGNNSSFVISCENCDLMYSLRGI